MTALTSYSVMGIHHDSSSQCQRAERPQRWPALKQLIVNISTSWHFYLRLWFAGCSLIQRTRLQRLTKWDVGLFMSNSHTRLDDLQLPVFVSTTVAIWRRTRSLISSCSMRSRKCFCTTVSEQDDELKRKQLMQPVATVTSEVKHKIKVKCSGLRLCYAHWAVSVTLNCFFLVCCPPKTFLLHPALKSSRSCPSVVIESTICEPSPVDRKWPTGQVHTQRVLRESACSSGLLIKCCWPSQLHSSRLLTCICIAQ